MKKQIAILALAALTLTGCQAVRDGIKTGRTVGTKVFDFADKAVDIAEKTATAAVDSTAKATTPVTTSTP